MKTSDLIRCGVIVLAIFLGSGWAAKAVLPTSSIATTEPAGKPSGKIAATVNAEPIYESELMAMMPEDAFADTLDDLKQSKLKRLVLEAIQSQFLAERKITVSEDQMADGIEKFKEMVKTPGCPCCGGGYANLEQFMKINAFSMREVRCRVRCDIGIKLYVERLIAQQTAPDALAATVKKLRPQIETDYAEAYAISFNYMRDANYFRDAKPVEAAKLKLADAALQRLKKGESFEKVAREMSDDDTSAPKGGAFGCIRTDFLGQEVEQVFQKLEPGTYSGVVKTPWGCCIVMRKKLTEDEILSVAKEQAASGAEEQAYNEFKAVRDRAKVHYGPPPASAPAPVSTK